MLKDPSIGQRAGRIDPDLETNWNDDPKPFVRHKTADEILDASLLTVSGSLTQDTRPR